MVIRFSMVTILLGLLTMNSGSTIQAAQQVNLANLGTNIGTGAAVGAILGAGLGATWYICNMASSALQSNQQARIPLEDALEFERLKLDLMEEKAARRRPSNSEEKHP